MVESQGWSGPISSDRSLVMKPPSTVWMQTFSKRVGEPLQLGVVVEFGAVRQAARPGEDRGDRIGRGLLALLVLAVVAGDGAMRGLRLDGVAVGRHQHGGHQAERAEALRHRVGLHVAVIILAGPDIAARPFQAGSHHVVDQAVLVYDLPVLEGGLELLLVDLLERCP